jgi:phage gp36-like protein
MVSTLPEIQSVTTLTSAHIHGFAGQAESLVNAKIARRYSLPLPEVPPLLQTLSTDIGIYYLLVKRLFTQERINASPWPDRYKDALTTLDQIADGTVTLVTTAGHVIAGRTDIGQIWSTTRHYTPTFWEGPTAEQVQDELKIADEGARR